ncbi:MAG: hypothetical protein EAZ92_13085, partial [Candidatus Kapaibacterium sp.]
MRIVLAFLSVVVVIFSLLFLVNFMNRSRTSRCIVIILTLVLAHCLSFSSLKAQYSYVSGFANLTSSWTPVPPNFNSGTFSIGGGQTATVAGAMTLGAGATMNVLGAANLVITNGVTFTNNGTLNVNNGGTLELQGTGGIAPFPTSANPVTYTGVNASLLYSGMAAKTTNDRELPTTMVGIVSANNSGALTIAHSATVTGAFIISQRVLLSGAGTTLRLNGNVNSSAQIDAVSAAQTLVIGGSGTFTGNLDLGGGSVFPGNLTLNRAGAIIQMRGNRTMSGVLNLTAGILKIQPGSNWFAMYNTTPGGIINASATSYIDVTGSVGLYWQLPASMVSGPTYTVPIGTTTQYLPVSLLTPTTGGATYNALFFAKDVGQTGGTMDCTTMTSLNTTESWYISNSAGGSLTAGVSFSAPSVNASTRLGFKKVTDGGTYPAMAGTTVLGNTITQATPFSLSASSTDNFFNLGSSTAPTVYTFQPASGDPSLATNWMPTANFANPCAEFIIPSGRTALMNANWNLGSAAGGVKLTVQSGGTLNTGNGATNAVRFMGNNSVFTLQNGANFITRNTAGLNGTSDITGAIQVLLGGMGFVTNYGTMVNFSFGAVTGSGSCNFGMGGQKLPVSQVATLNTNTAMGTSWSLNSPLTVQTAFTLASGSFFLSNSLVLSGAAFSSNVQGPDGRMILQNASSVLTITNPNGLTIQNGGLLDVISAAPIPCVLSNPVRYLAGATLTYWNITMPRPTGLELPTAMDGDVHLFSGSVAGIITLSAPTSINGSGTLNVGGSILRTLTNTLTITNPNANAVVNGGLGGFVEGPLLRAIPAGMNTGTWIFPVGKGTSDIPFAIVNPTTAGAAMIEVEAYNTSGGTGDGTTINTALGTEYWRTQSTTSFLLNGQMQLGRTTLAATQSVATATSAPAGSFVGTGPATYNGVPTPDLITQNTPQTTTLLAGSNRFFAVGTTILPTTYYYVSGDPSTSTNWKSIPDGFPAGTFGTSGWTFIVPSSLTTLPASAPIPLGAGVTMQVQGGATLNMGNVAITGAGSFQLLANGTLQTSRADGVNGTLPTNGAIQVTGTISYAVTANYILAATAAANANFSAVAPNKPPITDARNLTRNGSGMTTLATGLNLSGALSINTSIGSGLRLVGAMPGQVLTLTGAGSQIIQGTLELDANFTLANNNAVTPLAFGATGQFFVRNPAVAVNYVTGQPVSYVAGAILAYTGSTPLTTGLELPSPMLGNIAMSGTAGLVATLGAPTTLNGILNFNVNGQYLRTTPTNLLTIANTAPAAINGTPSGTAHVRGPLVRAIQTGGGAYTFPVGGGSAATYVPVNFSYTSAPASTVVTVEGFNTGSGGMAGTGITGLSTTEYWRINPSNAVTLVIATFTRNAVVPAGSRLGTSPTAAGTYNSFPSTVIPTTSISNTGTFPSLAAGNAFYTIGTGVTTYYYNNANVNLPLGPNNRLNWDTTPGTGVGANPPDFITANTAFEIDVLPTPQTATLTGNLTFGTGANPVTLTVPSGTTLNTGVSSVIFAGNNSRFNLQSGATLRTQHPQGIHGGTASADNIGAVQITAAAPNTVIFTYDPDANYYFGNASGNVRFGATTNRPAITQAANITIDAGAGNWIISNNMTVRTGGSLSILSGYLYPLLGTLTLNGPSSISTGAYLFLFAAGAQVINNNTMTVNGAIEYATTTAARLTGTSPMYMPNSELRYTGTFPTLTGAELPASMNGNLRLNGTGTLGLNAATTLNGSLILNSGTLSTATNTLTVANANFGAVTRTGGLVEGPLRRAFPAGMNSGAWLFPVGKGGVYLPFTVNNPNTMGGATAEVEAFNVGSGGNGDGTTILAPSISGTEYWRTQVTGGMFTDGLMQVGKTGLTGASILGSSLTQTGLYSSSGPNSFAAGTPPTLTQTIATGLTFFALGTPIGLSATGTTPPRNGNSITNTGTSAHNAASNVASQITFSAGPLTAATGRIFALQTWQNPLPAPTLAGATATLTPPTTRKAGERVMTTIMSANTASASLGAPFVWDYRVRTIATSPGTYFQMPANVTGLPAGAIVCTELADFNGDGNLDIATLQNGSSNVYIARGNGDGTFLAPAAVPLGAVCSRMTIGDFNNDGRIDIAGLTSVPNTMQRILNTSTMSGAITFGAGAGSGTGLSAGQAACLTVGDMNGDGNLDVVLVGDNENNLVSVMIGNGLGGFTGNGLLGLNRRSFGCSVADFDGDGDMDIALANRVTNGLHVLLNNGNGISYTNTGYLAGTDGGYPAVGDFDLDGDVDIALATMPGNIQVMTNNGNGTFTSGASYGAGVGSRYAAVQDVNGDGDLDLIASADMSANVNVFLGTAGATFNLLASYLPGAGAPLYLGMGDFDNDGDVDMVVPYTANNQLGVFKNAPSTYYFFSGNAQTPASWNSTIGGGGTPGLSFLPPIMVPAVPLNYIVEATNPLAVATANITLGANVFLRVGSGTTLNLGGVQVTGAGTFDLQAGGTLQAANGTGFNGGAITTTGRTWDIAANYIFAPTVANTRPMIATTQVNNFTTLPSAFNTDIGLLGPPDFLTVNGTFTGGSFVRVLCGSNLTLGAGAHTSAGGMWLGGTNGLTVNGTLTFTSGSNFVLVGTSGCGSNGSANGTGSVTYTAGAALRLVSGWVGTVNTTILPTTMNGDIEINGTATLGTGVSSQINGTFILNGTSRLNLGAGNSLALNSVITMNAGTTFGGTATSNLSVIGTGTITGSLAFAGGVQTLNNFTLNRTGTVLPMASPLTVGGTLALMAGRITNTLANKLVASNGIAGAVTTGGGYVDGFLERAMTTAGASYLFPVGQAAQYLPLTFTEAGGGTGNVIVNAQSGGGTTTVGTGITALNNTGRWQIQTATGTRSGALTLAPSAVLAANSVVAGFPTTITGTYNNQGPVGFGGGATISQSAPSAFTTTPVFVGTGTGVIAATYYYEAGFDPALPGSWGTMPGAGLGTPATDFATPSTTFIVESGTATVPAGANIVLNANAVQMTVQGSATLDMDNFTVTVAQTNCGFTLQNGATLRTAHGQGVNGTDNITGALRFSALVPPVGATITCAAGANYVFYGASPIAANFAAAAPKTNITQASDITYSGTNTLTVGSAITLNGALNVQSGTLALNSAAMTLAGAGSTVAGGATMRISGAGPSLVNTGGLQVDGTLEIGVAGSLTTTTPLYNTVSGLLIYNSTFNGSSGLELPATMNAPVRLLGGSLITLPLGVPQTFSNGLESQGGRLTLGLGAPVTINNYTATATGIPTIDFIGETLTLNGTTTIAGANAEFRGDASSNLILNGAMANSATSIKFGAGFQSLNNLTLNYTYAGIAPTLNSPLTVNGTATFTQGHLISSPTNLFRIANIGTISTTPAPSGASHIIGRMQRGLPVGGGSFLLPTGGGTASSYLPVTVAYTSTGGGTNFDAEAFPTAPPPTPTEAAPMQAGSLSTTEHWYTALSGSALNNATLTFSRSTPALAANAMLGNAATANGTYTGFASTVSGSNINNSSVFAPLNLGTAFYAIGTETPPPVRAGFGQSLTFNGTTQRVNTNTAISGSPLLLEAWINPSAGNGQIVGKNFVASLALNAARNVTFQVGDGVAWTSPVLVSASAVPLGAWSHVAVSYDGATMQVFINGVADGDVATAAAVANNVSAFSIGALSGAVPFFNGQIDEVRLWNTAVPQTTLNRFKGVEITASHPNWANLLGYWKFNEYSGNTAADSKGANTGTLVNAPTRVVSNALPSVIVNPTIGTPTSVLLPGMNPASPAPVYSITAIGPPTLFSTITPSPGNPVNITPTNAIPASYTSNFTYRIDNTLTNDTKTVAVSFEPRLTGSTQSAPPFTPITLTAPTLRGGTPPYTWNWSPAVNLSASNIPTPDFTGAAPQSYTVQITDALGFTASATVNVNIIAVSDTYYYISGDAGNPANWNSLPNGTGLVAPNFSIGGTSFVVMGNALGGSTTTATVQSAFTLGGGVEMMVQSPATLAIADAASFTNNGTLTIEGNASTGATLQLQGLAGFSGNNVVYQSGQSRLRYSTPNAVRTATTMEFPNALLATLV